MEEGYALRQIDSIKNTLAEITDIHDALKIRDQATAIAVYADAVGAEEIAQKAKETQLRAERKAGEILTTMPKAKAGRPRKEIGDTMSPISNRLPTLSDYGISKKQSSRWQQIASIPTEKFEEQIDESKSKGRELTQAALLRNATRQKRVEEINKASKPTPELSTDILYPVIYADPPWRYEHSKTDSRKIENHYPTMDLKSICSLPVGELATDNAVLFLWATNPKLSEAFEVINAWGFLYRTNMVWTKPQIGMGYYVRSQHELLLIATRGSVPTPEPANRPNSVVEYSRMKHSKKPSVFYEVIESMYPEYKKIELFSRARVDGWDAWGNEV